ncbi:C45 family peptidase [Marivita sp. GX14005]|uniref:C45 family autoproteolytic acyltransferase/hydolase n=1 Tax=Marivita sp. GX14005 TaxID=2942276 RepID=UPI00201A0BC7|nr:C45 family peptidase [Marivita sp. GX14005]MCL3882441.1 C45 family peptidase [Marivita sp. GX14005]
MYDDAKPELGWHRAAGDPHRIGLILGRAGRDAVREVLLGSDYWADVMAHAQSAVITEMAQNVQSLFPAIWQELTGLAEGLELPLVQVLTWNCRGDLMTNVPDGCTTVQIPGDAPVIAHNEDGLPGFHGHAFLAEVAPQGAPGFTSFCYPGSLPGHTFAVTGAGIVQAVNNLRLRGVVPKVPRMVLGRALLDCATLDAAISLLETHNESGGFHMTLAQAGDPRVMSVEYGGGHCAAVPIETPSMHTNHALRMKTGPEGQLVTRSSADRQAHGTTLVEAGTAPLDILRDTSGEGLPIHRTEGDDPDNENTLATAVFHLEGTGVDWAVHDQSSRDPVYSGRVERA